VANNRWTWYERGYVARLPESGLPAAGSMVTNASSADQVYQLAGSYSENNVALVDLDSPVVNLTPVSPVAVRALSFLTATAVGPATNQCVVQHADGTSETNRLVSPDWADVASAPAFYAGGRVDINNGVIECVGGSGPFLFAAELAVSNAVSPVTNIVLRVSGGTTAMHTAVLAVSGATSSQPPIAAQLSIRLDAGGGLVIESSAPGRLERTAVLKGAGTVWEDAGAIVDSVTVTVAAGEGARFYRVKSGE
ncbi:MAG TPA: hypothetical protein VJA21_08680, partial [Verrucomicrobiae bacterium]